MYLNYTQELANNITEGIENEFEGDVVIESDAWYISWINTIKEELSTRSYYELISVYICDCTSLFVDCNKCL